MMRSWGNRADTYVCDEPFYAHYLSVTGLQHPGAAEILAQCETDWQLVVSSLLGEIPEAKTIFYQKHMAHHLLPEMDRSWLSGVENCFLIRDPYEMLTSLIQNIPEPRIEDTGLPQQVQIFDYVKQHAGRTPPILDARDVLTNPREMLELLCRQIGVVLMEEMFSWPAGPRETDGVWAPYWYHAVEKSTGFQPYAPKSERLPDRLLGLHERCRECYDLLYAERLAVGGSES
jgi:hypothetical protein